QAADLPAKAPRAQPVYSDWAGFYIGIHGGYGWGEGDGGVEVFPFNNLKPRGGLVGGHAGYLWQWSNWVGGLEVDYSAASLKESQVFLTDDRVTVSSKIDALSSAPPPPGGAL